ncbi:site-specific integrase [Ruminococcus sp. CLA-AA-H200]|uniref:Site-specific integrase n=1 Tax=Ruminococcus turbiniformis TaxID=2881258 RepID=A0ABS8FWM2_9FIRM|nr:tyrosine-type recombinase/integrase [Ruminococcus turbiniformis]MCC2253567.1 site-specific integrase [Ruminococcus turbiniformis]
MERRKDNRGRVLRAGESQRKDLTYMYRYTDPSGKRKYVYAKTLSDLRKKETDINKDLQLGIYTNEYTLNQLFDRYLAQSTTLKDRTKYKYELEYKRWVKDSWLGNKKIKDIVKSDIVLFYKELDEKGYSHGTIRCVHKYINNSLNLAFDDDLIRKNYAEGCIKPYCGKNPRKAMTKEETRKLLEECESKPYGQNYLLLVKLMLLTGLRIGEATGLTWKDIDLKNRVIDVNHQFVQGDANSRTKYHIDTTKTESGTRKVPMSDDVYQLLLYLKETTYFDAFKFGVNVDGYSGFVVHSRTGLPILTARINDYLYRIVSEYNACHEDQLPKISCHICRHTFCTRLAEMNINPNVLQKIMGHASYRTTADIYISTECDFVNEEFFRVMRGIS